MTVIEASLLGKSFNSLRVLGAIDLSIERGSVVGLLGTNGSGKSTLIKCLLGLLKPDTGISRIFDEDSWNLSAETKARIGYVPQKPNFYPWMLPLDLINFFGAFYDNWDHLSPSRDPSKSPCPSVFVFRFTAHSELYAAPWNAPCYLKRGAYWTIVLSPHELGFVLGVPIDSGIDISVVSIGFTVGAVEVSLGVANRNDRPLFPPLDSDTANHAME